MWFSLKLKKSYTVDIYLHIGIRWIVLCSIFIKVPADLGIANEDESWELNHG